MYVALGSPPISLDGKRKGCDIHLEMLTQQPTAVFNETEKDAGSRSSLMAIHSSTIIHSMVSKIDDLL